MVFSLPLTLLVLEIFKVKVVTFSPISAYISWRDVNYQCFWWEFRIFDHSHRFLGPKNPYLDTKNSKIGLETPKLIKDNPWNRILRSHLTYLYFRDWILSNFGVSRPILEFLVSRWGFLGPRNRWEWSKLRNSHQKH